MKCSDEKMRKVHCACKTVPLQEAREAIFQVYLKIQYPVTTIQPSSPQKWCRSLFQFGWSSSHRYKPIVEVLNGHSLSISLAAIHRLASLLDRGQHGIVRDSRFGGNIRGLGFEANIESFDTYKSWSVSRIDIREGKIALLIDGERRKSRRKCKRKIRGIQTFQTLQDSLDGAGAAAAAHRHVELVLVVRHGWNKWDVAKSWRVSVGQAGRLKKAEVEISDVRSRGKREDDYDDETSWPDIDYIENLYSIGDYYRGC